MQKQPAKNAIIGCLSSEDFGVLLPGCKNHLATYITEKCRKVIEKIDTSTTGYQFIDCKFLCV